VFCVWCLWDCVCDECILYDVVFVCVFVWCLWFLFCFCSMGCVWCVYLVCVTVECVVYGVRVVYV